MPYNSISAGEKNLSYGVLEAVLSCSEKPLLFCFAESYGGLKSVSFSCSNQPLDDTSFVVSFENIQSENEDSFELFIDFLEDKTTVYKSHLYTLKRG